MCTKFVVWNIRFFVFSKLVAGEVTVAPESTEKILQLLERIVHVDLKGALPNVECFKGFFKMLRDFGATGILLEYENVFQRGGIVNFKGIVLTGWSR